LSVQTERSNLCESAAVHFWVGGWVGGWVGPRVCVRVEVTRRFAHNKRRESIRKFSSGERDTEVLVKVALWRHQNAT
jgi:hypothetical protein